MFKDRYILRLCEDLISIDPAAVGFPLQVSDDAVSQTFSLIIAADRNISHDAPAERTGADELAIIKKSHGIVNDSRKSQIKAFQEFDNFCFFFRIGQEYFTFGNHMEVLL